MSISILKLHEYADAANNIIGGGLTARMQVPKSSAMA